MCVTVGQMGYAREAERGYNERVLVLGERRKRKDEHRVWRQEQRRYLEWTTPTTFLPMVINHADNQLILMELSRP